MAYDKNKMKEAREIPCVCCGGVSEYHHIKSIKSGGTDDEHNLLPVCRATHQLIHQHGLSYVAIMHINIKGWLLSMGYEKCDLRKKWVWYA